MNPYKRKFCYDFKAVILLTVPVLITMAKLSGYELMEIERIDILKADVKILIMIAGMVAGISYFLFKYAGFHSMTVNIRGSRDFPEVLAIIETLCNKLKIAVPEVGFLESSIPNAFVYKIHKKPFLVLTVPLVEILDQKELETVLAHELTHIKNKDMELRKYSLLVRFVLFLNPLVHLIEPFISRSREYLADETAAWITGAPNKLASALLKIEDYTSSYKSRKFPVSTPPDVFFFGCTSCAPYIFSRCPSTENRIRRLISLDKKKST